MDDESAIRTRFEMLAPFLNERTRRLAAAAEAAAIGRGGIARVARATGVSRRAIASGLAQLQAPDDLGAGRIRRPGGGRKQGRGDRRHPPGRPGAVDRPGDPRRPGVAPAVDLQERPQAGRGTPAAWGTPPAIAWSPNCSTSSATASRPTARRFEGKGHPDRNAQFEHINAKVQAALKAGEPVISVDAKKKELVGDFKNAGREWQPEGQPGAGAGL